MTGPFGTTQGPWECDEWGGEYEGQRYGDVAFLLSAEQDRFEPSVANARAIAQVPAMLELVAAMNESGLEPVKWVEMARAIARKLEEKQ